MNKRYALGLFVAALVMIQLACSAATPPSTPDTVATLNGLYTAAAQTATLAAPPSATVTPGLPAPTASPIAPAASPTPFVLPTATVRPRPCDAAEFVKDVTIADGSVLSRGATFTKTWRLQNTGTCTWTSSYAMVFVSGDRMSGPTAVGLPGNVNSGESVDISATFIAPDEDGHYRSYWKLRNASNMLFGLGSGGDVAFWVDITVKGPAYKVYDFVQQYCEAEWENNNSALPCPGTQDDERGFVLQLDSPRLEDGTRSPNRGLLTRPRDSRDGIISGTYPAFTVHTGDRFRAIVGCRFNAERCNVTFRLDFRTGGKTRTLGTWEEVYEGQFTTIDLDLSRLDGQRGKFILYVESNGPARDDEAIWVAPRVLRAGEPGDQSGSN